MSIAFKIKHLATGELPLSIEPHIEQLIDFNYHGRITDKSGSITKELLTRIG